MSIARKIALLVFLPIALLLLVNVGNGIEREVELFESDIKRDQRALVRALASLADDLAQRESADRVVTLVREAGELARTDVTIEPLSVIAERQVLTQRDLDRLGRGLSMTRIDVDDEDSEHVTTSKAFVTPDGTRHVITVTSSLANRDAYISATILRSILTLALMLVASFVVAFVVGDRIVGRPVARLLQKLRKVGEGDLSERMPDDMPGELALIADEMNRTIEKLEGARRALEEATTKRLEAIEQLRHAERLATVGQLVSGIAHEVGTPLHVITSRARRLQADASIDARQRGEAQLILDEAGRMKRIVEQLLAFARRGPSQRAPADVAALIDQAGTLLLPMLRKGECRLSVQVDQGVDATASVDADALTQVFTNLIQNAIHAMPEGGPIDVLVSRDARGLVVRFADQGTGMPADVRARAFEPFFTTKGTGQGTGLGLSVAYGIVVEHQGTITIEENAPRGTAFVIILPPAVAATGVSGPSRAALVDENAPAA